MKSLIWKYLKQNIHIPMHTLKLLTKGRYFLSSVTNLETDTLGSSP